MAKKFISETVRRLKAASNLEKLNVRQLNRLVASTERNQRRVITKLNKSLKKASKIHADTGLDMSKSRLFDKVSNLQNINVKRNFQVQDLKKARRVTAKAEGIKLTTQNSRIGIKPARRKLPTEKPKKTMGRPRGSKNFPKLELRERLEKGSVTFRRIRGRLVPIRKKRS